MTTTEHLAAHGPNKTARALLNKRVAGLIGLSLEDLADTCEIADKVEEIASFLENGDISGAIECVKEFTLDDIEENVFG